MAAKRFFGRIGDRCHSEKQAPVHALVFALCLIPVFAFFASGAKAHGSKGAPPAKKADQLDIQVKNDRLTLSVTDVPQVYLHGVIDADAPQRFAAQIQSGKIPHGSDVYLNSSSGDLHAALALGRMFRSNGMVTHLGTPRKPPPAPNTSVCEGACTYAYLGGLYRWAPTGGDRIGLSSPAPGDENNFAAYLKEMNIDLSTFMPTLDASHGMVLWLSAEQMVASGLANNGHLPLTAQYQSLATGPFLTLDQIDRHGEHRMTIECKPGRVMITAYDRVGAARARQIVARAARSYFELNRKETLTEQDGASVADTAVMIARPYAPARLEYVIFAQSIGAWVADQKSAFRAGFTFDLEPVRSTLKNYYNACWHASPWPHPANHS